MGVELTFENQEVITYWVEAGRTIRLPASQIPPTKLKARVWLTKADGGMVPTRQVNLDIYCRPMIEKIHFSKDINILRLKGHTYGEVGELEAWAVETRSGDPKSSRLEVNRDLTGRFVIDDLDFGKRICPAYKVVHKVDGRRLLAVRHLVTSDNRKLPGRIITNIIKRLYIPNSGVRIWPNINRLKDCRVFMPKETAESIVHGVDVLRKKKLIWALEPLNERLLKKSKRWLKFSQSILLLATMSMWLGYSGIAICVVVWTTLLSFLVIISNYKKTLLGGYWCHESKQHRMPRLPRFLKAFSANLQILFGYQSEEIGLFPVKTVPVALKAEMEHWVPASKNGKAFNSVTVGASTIKDYQGGPIVFSTQTKTWMLTQNGSAWEVNSLSNDENTKYLQPNTPEEIDGIKVTIYPHDPLKHLDFIAISLRPDGQGRDHSGKKYSI